MAIAGLSVSAKVLSKSAWPDRPVKLIVPFSSGALTDATARLLADQLSQRIGQAIVVDNVAGAGGIVGTTQAARANPDGYTLLLAPDSNMLISPHIHKNLLYDPVVDFSPIGKIGTTTLVLLANPKSGIRSIADVLSRSRPNGPGLTYGTSGTGTNTHVAVEMFRMNAGVNLVHVPYRGGAPAISDLLGGQIDLVSSTPASAAAHLAAGRLVALAVATTQRSSALPNVPTFMESGVNCAYNSWLGIFAPKETPESIVSLLNSELNLLSANTKVREDLSRMGVIASTSNPEAFRSEIKRDLERFGTTIRKANISISIS